MGLSNHLCDLSGGSIPFLLVTIAASWLSFLRSLHHYRPAAKRVEAVAAGGFAMLITFVDKLKACRPVTHFSDGGEETECVVCKCAMRTREKVRLLACCHKFHFECLDGWIGGANPSCPLCRSPILS